MTNIRTKSICGLTSHIISGGSHEERAACAADVLGGGEKLMALVQTSFNGEPRIEVLTRKGAVA